MEIPHYDPHPLQRQFLEGVSASTPRRHFRDEALIAVRKAAEKFRRFTVDDVWPFVPGLATLAASDLRAIGSVMLQAAKDGIISKTPHFVPSANKTCHRCPRRVWTSNVYGQAQPDHWYPSMVAR